MSVVWGNTAVHYTTGPIMKSIHSLPRELLALIFEYSCDTFSDIRNLLLASKVFHYTWTIVEPSILWRIGQREVIAFSEALITVRATEIAKEFLLKGSPPPDPFPIAQLSGDVSLPSPEEVKLVLDFDHLARCLEKLARRLDWQMEDVEEAPGYWWEVWRERFHITAYRYFLSGAMLYRAYHEPLISTPRPPDFLKGLMNGKEVSIGFEEDREVFADDDWFSESEKKHLAQFPVYHLEKHAEHAAIFQPLEELFVEESRKRWVRDGKSNLLPGTSLYEAFGEGSQNLQGLDSGHADVLFHQVLHCLFTNVDFISGLIRNFDGSNRHNRLFNNTSKEMRGKVRTVSVICLGPLLLEEITMPGKVEDVVETGVVGEQVLPHLSSRRLNSNTRYLGFQYMEYLLDGVFDYSGVPNRHTCNREADHPSLYFLAHMLRKYFGLRIALNAGSSTITAQDAWTAFTSNGRLFCERDMRCAFYSGSDLLESVNRPIPTPYFEKP